MSVCYNGLWSRFHIVTSIYVNIIHRKFAPEWESEISGSTRGNVFVYISEVYGYLRVEIGDNKYRIRGKVRHRPAVCSYNLLIVIRRCQIKGNCWHIQVSGLVGIYIYAYAVYDAPNFHRSMPFSYWND